MSPRDKLKPNGNSKIAKSCKRCDKEFFVWPSQVRRGRKYCSRSCMKEVTDRECEQCGLMFTIAKKSKRRICGKKCPALRVAYNCIVCSISASRPRCFGQGKFCSNKCYHLWLQDNDIKTTPNIGMRRSIKKRVSRRKQRIRAGDLINDHDVFEFYEWTCIVCETEIDPDLPWPNKMSATLDHILPLSKGGTHTWDNVAPSHLLCNTKKDSKVMDDVIERHQEMWSEKSQHGN